MDYVPVVGSLWVDSFALIRGMKPPDELRLVVRATELRPDRLVTVSSQWHEWHRRRWVRTPIVVDNQVELDEWPDRMLLLTSGWEKRRRVG